ncbi:hypothetical protein ACFWD7_27880 [Streptomyces mirabilis]|uniref:hypothetical protein n=1 Tax=Streptomyces mirabilis TaxID=68239 RepID=UPI0036C4CE20
MRGPDDELVLDEAHRQLLRTGQQHRRLAISDAQRRHHEAVAGLDWYIGTAVIGEIDLEVGGPRRDMFAGILRLLVVGQRRRRQRVKTGPRMTARAALHAALHGDLRVRDVGFRPACHRSMV